MLSLEESYFFNDDSGKNGSDFGSYGRYSFRAFYLRFNVFIGSVSVLRSDVFAPTRVESKGDIFASEVFVPTGVNSKGG